ncbi:MAG TPA: S9 family peptidase [Gemmatimonadales bacterium]
MRRHICLLIAGLCGAAVLPPAGEAQRQPPSAKRIQKVDTLHGEILRDDYYWLRQKSNPEVRRYLEAENAYTEASLAHTAPLRDSIYREMVGRIKETDLTVPWRYQGYWYYSRTEKGKNYPIYCRKKGSLDAPEEVILDQNRLAEGKAFHALGGWDVSPDGNRLLYLEDTTAFRVYTLHVKDLRTGALLPDSISNVWSGTAWADTNTFFYTRADSAKRAYQIWRHQLGKPAGPDVKVFQEDSVLYNAGVYRSRSGSYVFIGSEGFRSAGWWAVPTNRPTEAPRLLLPRRPDVLSTPDHVPGRFLILTNDGATNFRIVSTPEGDASPSGWRDWQPASDSVFIEGMDVFRTHVVVSERAGGLRRLRVVRLADQATHFVTFPDPAYGVYPSENHDFDAAAVRFTYSSLTTPDQVVEYDLTTRTRKVLKQKEVPSGFDQRKYEMRRVTARARDGEEVPVTLLLPREFPKDGSRPFLLYAYGSYGSTTEPDFDSTVLSLVDRGFGYAIAHVRGGQEMGRRWYDDGKMMHKKNTFNDFIDVAEYLVRERYTSRDRLVANGASAGGLLMGVIATWRPDLFRAVVADVPFVDVINTMLDASIPLTAQEWEQWGNPRNPEQYAYMKSYSPYDNVAPKEYPALLITTSFNDSQVMYWEPAKWVAKLRATKRGSNPIYLRTNFAGGHGGSSGRYDRLKELAFEYAFMLDAVKASSSAVP